jgi:hypothetical protein
LSTSVWTRPGRQLQGAMRYPLLSCGGRGGLHHSAHARTSTSPSPNARTRPSPAADPSSNSWQARRDSTVPASPSRL